MTGRNRLPEPAEAVVAAEPEESKERRSVTIAEEPAAEEEPHTHT